MESGERSFTLEASPHLVLAFVAAVMVVALTLAGVVLTTLSARHSLNPLTTTTPSRAIQAAEQSCQYVADTANTYGMTEPVGVAQIRDQTFDTCMADRGFPLPA